MLMIVPTRGRPHKAREVLEAVAATRAFADVLFVTDLDDPAVEEYEKIELPHWGRMLSVPTKGMVKALNLGVKAYGGHYSHIGFMGDDHRPRTKNWDVALSTIYTEYICYGNDLMQGWNLPTHVVMPQRMVKALNWEMAPECFDHLFIDNYWKALGEAVGRLHYDGTVVIEHMHPQAGKTEWDPGYVRVNSPEVWSHDEATWSAYSTDGRLARDVQLIKDAYDV